eukprot:COSAG06_NODE_27436_length_593_cov_0.981781_1_plen_139_part_01
MDIGQVKICWLHFDTFSDYVKALQGYGGLEYAGPITQRNELDLPGEWVDGPYKPEFDLLKHVPGATPEARRAFLLAQQESDQETLNMRLLCAIECKVKRRVHELLGLDSENNPVPEDEREPMYADPNFRHPITNGSMLV